MPMLRANMAKQVANPPGKKGVTKAPKAVPCRGCPNPAACRKAGRCMKEK